MLQFTHMKTDLKAVCAPDFGCANVSRYERLAGPDLIASVLLSGNIPKRSNSKQVPKLSDSGVNQELRWIGRSCEPDP
jgi:hypothetical protein